LPKLHIILIGLAGGIVVGLQSPPSNLLSTIWQDRESVATKITVQGARRFAALNTWRE
jgi:hypothetical protein